MKHLKHRLLLALACAALGMQGFGAWAQGAAVPPTASIQKDKPAAPGGEVAALILASEETVLSSQMAGKVKLVSVGLGEGVKRGGRIMEFDCSEQQAQLDA